MLELFSILYLLIIFFCIFLLPGFIISNIFFKKLDKLERFALSLGLSVAILPVLVFSMALLFHTVVTKILVLSVVILLLIFFALIKFKQRVKTKNWLSIKNFELKNKDIFLILLLIFIFSIYLINFDDNFTSGNSILLVKSTFAIINKPVRPVLEIEDHTYRFISLGKLPENLMDYFNEWIPTLSKDRCLGFSVILSLPVLFFNFFGFRLLYAINGLLISIFIFLIIKKLFKNYWLSLVSMLSLSLNSFVLHINTLNENLMAFSICSMLIYLLLYEKKPWFYILIGLVFGVLGGVRHVSALFLIPIFVKIFQEKKSCQKFIFFTIGVLITAFPWMYWHQYAFGKIIVHETQVITRKLVEGNIYEYTLGPFKFKYHGILNFPFYPKIVRSLSTPYPPLLLIPLLLIKKFGIFLISFFLLGIIDLWKRDKKLLLILFLWIMPLLMLLTVQSGFGGCVDVICKDTSYWSRIDFLFLVLTPIMIFIATGIKFLFDMKKIESKFFVFLIISLLLFSFVRFSYNLTFELDPREIHILHLQDNNENLIFQRRILTKVNLFPEFFTQVRYKKISNFLNELERENIDMNKYDFNRRVPQYLRLVREVRGIKIARLWLKDPRMEVRVGFLNSRVNSNLNSSINAENGSINAIQNIEVPNPCYHVDANILKNDNELKVKLFTIKDPVCSTTCINCSVKLTTGFSLDVLPGEYNFKVLVDEKLVKEEKILVG